MPPLLYIPVSVSSRASNYINVDSFIIITVTVMLKCIIDKPDNQGKVKGKVDVAFMNLLFSLAYVEESWTASFEQVTMSSILIPTNIPKHTPNNIKAYTV